MELHLDLETRSTVELKSAGVYRYAEDPTTDVWCACYAVDDGPVQSWEPGDPVPQEVIDAVANGYRVVAHNAQFERTVWRLILAPRYGWPEPDLEQWHCTAAMAAAMSLPRDLAGAAGALGLPVQKDDVGRRLMLQMTKPRAGAPDGRLEWYDDRKRLDRLIEYCKQDVEVERALGRMLLPLIPTERSLFLLDARINDRGILVDLPLVRASQQVVEKTMRRLDARLEEATGGVIARATQVSRITRWLQMEGLETESLDKAALAGLLAQHHDPDIQAVLETRQEAAKSSTAKLKAMAACAGADGRARGMLQFLGAARTGRFCLAEDTRVLVKTPLGETFERPIQHVQPDDLVWDGGAWVAHEGVVFSGYKEVITHDGVTATAEHKVFISDTTQVTLGEAKRLNLPLHRSEP